MTTAAERHFPSQLRALAMRVADGRADDALVADELDVAAEFIDDLLARLEASGEGRLASASNVGEQP